MPAAAAPEQAGVDEIWFEQSNGSYEGIASAMPFEGM
jgi:hypothetical protein